MSRRCLSRKVIADRQRRGAKIREWKAISPEQQNLIIRRLSTRKAILRANRNAKAIEEQTQAEPEPVEEAV
jgi:predicted Fe-S protein YdhL (DUF1289 family)